MRIPKRSLIALVALFFLGGCNAFEFPLYVLFGGQKKTIPAEYEGLNNARTAIVIVAGPGVDFEYPYARHSLALWIANRLQEHVKGIEFVSQDVVDRFQRENLDWYEIPVGELGREFQAQRILYVDLLTYTMLEEHSVNLLRGLIIGDVRVYDIDADAELPAYQTEISAVFPEHSPVPVSDEAWQKIPRMTMLAFAEKLAMKFFDHKVAND